LLGVAQDEGCLAPQRGQALALACHLLGLRRCARVRGGAEVGEKLAHRLELVRGGERHVQDAARQAIEVGAVGGEGAVGDILAKGILLDLGHGAAKFVERVAQRGNGRLVLRQRRRAGERPAHERERDDASRRSCRHDAHACSRLAGRHTL
jgi:hypothetical protein